ncbi:MAG: PQQ-binding-like beta-propeller repeat protein [Steroidobacterales bacterium]
MKIRRTPAVLVTLAASLSSPLSAQPSFHGDNARTGVYDSVAAAATPKVIWKFQTGAPIFSSAAVVDGVVYVASDDSFLYAVDEATGSLKWKFETQGRSASSPAVRDGVVYFGSYDGAFYAVDAATGKEKWKFDAAYERRFAAPGIHGNVPAHQIMPDAWDFYQSSPVIDRGRVYFGSGDGNVYALDEVTGALRWKFHTADVVHSSPAIAGDTLYIGSFDTWLYAIDAERGTERWRFKTGEDPVNYNQTGLTSSPVVVDGTVYFGCRDAHVYAVDAATGKQKWAHYTDQGWVSATPAVRDNTLYVGTGSSLKFLALDAATGTPRFSVPIKSAIFSSVALAGNLAVVGTFSGELDAFDAMTGALVWQFVTDARKADARKIFKPDGKIDADVLTRSNMSDFENMYVSMDKRLSVGSILASPVVDKGTIFIGTSEGILYALR